MNKIDRVSEKIYLSREKKLREEYNQYVLVGKAIEEKITSIARYWNDTKKQLINLRNKK